MPRATNNPASRQRRKRVLRKAKGFYLGRQNYRQANETIKRAMAYATRDRRVRKREFRALWILRVNAACRQNDISYSRFIAGLHKANVELDRKSLAEIAVSDADAFSQLVAIAKESAAK